MHNATRHVVSTQVKVKSRLSTSLLTTQRLSGGSRQWQPSVSESYDSPSRLYSPPPRTAQVTGVCSWERPRLAVIAGDREL